MLHESGEGEVDLAHRLVERAADAILFFVALVYRDGAGIDLCVTASVATVGDMRVDLVVERVGDVRFLFEFPLASVIEFLASLVFCYGLLIFVTEVCEVEPETGFDGDAFGLETVFDDEVIELVVDIGITGEEVRKDAFLVFAYIFVAGGEGGVGDSPFFLVVFEDGGVLVPYIPFASRDELIVFYGSDAEAGIGLGRIKDEGPEDGIFAEHLLKVKNEFRGFFFLLGVVVGGERDATVLVFDFNHCLEY